MLSTTFRTACKLSPHRVSPLLLNRNMFAMAIDTKPAIPKQTFPSRQNTVKQATAGNYQAIVDEFGTYGRFVNFCVSGGISLTRAQRRGVLTVSLQA